MGGSTTSRSFGFGLTPEALTSADRRFRRRDPLLAARTALGQASSLVAQNAARIHLNSAGIWEDAGGGVTRLVPTRTE